MNLSRCVCRSLVGCIVLVTAFFTTVFFISAVLWHRGHSIDQAFHYEPRAGGCTGVSNDSAAEIPVNVTGWGIRPLHVMKAGGGSVNVFMHYVCDGLPPTLYDTGRATTSRRFGFFSARTPSQWLFRHYMFGPVLGRVAVKLGLGRRSLERVYGEHVAAGVCPRLSGSRDFAGHVPVQPCDFGHLAGFLREPSHRSLSQFYDLGGRPQLRATPGLPLRWAAELQIIQSPAQYLNYTMPNGVQPVKGCQVKMVLGLQCFAPVSVTPAMVKEAIRRLSTAFVFIGLTEFWAVSVELFHRKFGGTTKPFELLNNKRGSHLATGVENGIQPLFQAEGNEWIEWHSRHGSYNVSLLEGVRDTADEALYEAALGLFEQDLRRYGLDAAHGVSYELAGYYTRALSAVVRTTRAIDARMKHDFHSLEL